MDSKKPDRRKFLKGGAALAGLAAGGSVRVVTYTQFFGNTLGGESVQSDNFEFPVDLCQGCLVLFSASDDNPSSAFPQPNCNLASAAAASGTGSTSSLPSPCNTGQDYPTDCSQCLGQAVCNPQ